MFFLKTNKSKIAIITLTVILIVIMALSSFKSEKAGIFSETFSIVLKPLQSFVTFVGNSFSYGSDKGKYEKENSSLKKQIAEIKNNENNYKKLANENAKLRAMLEIEKSSSDIKYVASDVLAYDSSNWTSVFKINKGLSSGIKKNDTVITETGLVGYVSSVGRTWSYVTTIIDSSASVSALVERSDEYCMIQGDISLFDKGCCLMKYSSTDTVLSVGDILITSGEGGVFSKGIQIGKIKEITQNKNGMSQDAVVEPFVDFLNLETVLVIVG